MSEACQDQRTEAGVDLEVANRDLKQDPYSGPRNPTTIDPPPGDLDPKYELQVLIVDQLRINFSAWAGNDELTFSGMYRASVVLPPKNIRIKLGSFDLTIPSLVNENGLYTYARAGNNGTVNVEMIPFHGRGYRFEVKARFLHLRQVQNPMLFEMNVGEYGGWLAVDFQGGLEGRVRERVTDQIIQTQT